MVTCVDMRKIELLLVGINISLAILPGVPIGSPRNAKLEHRDFSPRYAWLGGDLVQLKQGRDGSVTLYPCDVTFVTRGRVR